MKIALALIVKGSDSEADSLKEALTATAPYVDGIFVTVTQPNQKVMAVAQAFGAEVSSFAWTGDFSEARNFNFDQVPKSFDYILWMDADDVFQGLEKLRPTIEEHPQTDLFIFHYMYAFDEHGLPVVVHPKTQVVKNDGCVRWWGRLHEDFKETRSLTRHFVTGIERIHLTNPDRIDDSKNRNYEIALKQLKDEPKDPRSYWNLGNSLKALGRNEEALEVFADFLRLSQSDDEKYIVRLRRAECLWGTTKKADAIDEARAAIGLKPNYPDAYHLLGSLFYDNKQYQQAMEMYLNGMVKKPPYYSILVYNPRDYDFIPLQNLAKCFFNLSRPDQALVCLQQCAKIYPKDETLKSTIKLMKKEAKAFDVVTQLVLKLSKITDKEKLKAELEKVPKKYQPHPGICNLRNRNFVKETSSGKDLSFFCGFTEEEWNPATIKKKGIGGSEEAVLWITKLLSKAGWNITVYNNCGYMDTFDGVTYKPFWMYNYRDKQDVTIFWRALKPLDWDVNSTKIFVDLHDVISPGEINEKRLEKIDKIFVKSKFHRSLFEHVPDDKFAIIPNGIDSELFSETLTRDTNLIVNTSSADRSLSALLKGFEIVKKAVPDAKLKWAYGWGVFDSSHAGNAPMMAWKEEMIAKMKGLGVEELGRVNHDEVAKLYLTANVFGYPSEFGEIDCISLTKAMAAGAIPVTTDFAAMGEKLTGQIHSDKTKDTWARNYQFDFALEDEGKIQDWANRVIAHLTNPETEDLRLEMREGTQNKYDWNKIALQWQEELQK